MSNCKEYFTRLKHGFYLLVLSGMLICSAGCAKTIQYQDMSNDTWIQEQVDKGAMTQAEAEQFKVLLKKIIVE